MFFLGLDQEYRFLGGRPQKLSAIFTVSYRGYVLSMIRFLFCFLDFFSFFISDAAPCNSLTYGTRESILVASEHSRNTHLLKK